MVTAARAALFVFIAVLFAAPAAGAVPPADPAGLTRLRLDNGLRLWLRPAPTGDEPEVGLLLVVRAGSLDETDDQPGVAYLAKRAAGLGTGSVPGGRLDEFRTRLGTRGRWAPASRGGHAGLTHESVTYTLAFEPGDEDAWGDALAHFADLLSGWSPDEQALERARADAAERAASMSPVERARQRFIPDLFPDHPLGRRPLIPALDALQGTGVGDVASYLDRCYRPELATLIVVGDFDPDRAVALVGERLAGVGRPGAPARDRRPPPASGVAGRVSFHAVEGFDPGEVALLSIGAREPEHDADPVRAEVFDEIAAELVGARVRVAAALADAGVVSAETIVKPWIRGVRIAEISVRAEPGALDAVGLGVGAELARIARDGFRPDELRAARAATLRASEARAADWADATAYEIAERLAFAARSEPDAWAGPAESFAHTARVLAASTDRELDAHARRAFLPGSLACVMLADPAEGVPARDAPARVLAAANDDRPPARGAVPERLTPPADPASVERIAHDPAIGVWTARLSNGVLVRAKRTPGPPIVRVGIAEGPSREDGATAGRTVHAAKAWRFPTVGPSDAAGVRAWSVSRGLTHRAWVGDDMVFLEVRSPETGSLEDALHLAASLLAEPGVDPAYTARSEHKEIDPGPAIRRLGERMLAPGDPRAAETPADAAHPDELSAWLADLARAPLEISVVGQAAPDAAIEAAAAAFGSLPARPEPSYERSGRWGALPADESIHRIVSDGRKPEALLGLVFADAGDFELVRPMIVAAAGVRAELEAMRRAGELNASPEAWVWLGDGLPRRATLVVRCEKADDPDAAMRAIERAIERVASGVSDDAVIRAELERTARLVERARENPEFWSDRLSRLASLGQDTGSLSGMPASYASLTVRSVRDALARASAEGVRKPVIVVAD